jgi:hypothetical protein
VIPDDIPALERDDPRIELAIAEGEMENYEVMETTGIQKLHLMFQSHLLLQEVRSIIPCA